MPDSLIPYAWSARCDCYNGHNSSSGRCQARNVTDPTRKPNEEAFCEYCRKFEGLKKSYKELKDA